MFGIASFPIFPVVVISCVLMASPATAMAEEYLNNADRPLVFGFLPILSTQKLFARFAPLTDYLAKRLGRPVKFETAPDYAEFIRRTNTEKRYDILFTAPHFYYQAQRQAGYRVIVRVNAPKMSAIIVASRTGKIKSVSDLRNRRIAVPDHLSLGAMLVRNHLSEAGLEAGKNISFVFTPSHNASLLSTYKGATDAAGLMIPPYRRASDKIRKTMQIIATTKGSPHMPISVAANLSGKDKVRLKQVLLNMQHDSEGRKLLQHMSWPGFVASSPAEYDQMDWAAKLIQP